MAHDDAELLARMAEVVANGTGWINVSPVIEEENEPPPPGPFAFLGGSTHHVPTVTWMPGKRAANGTVKPTTVGLQHASGPRVAWRLRDLGCALPEGLAGHPGPPAAGPGGTGAGRRRQPGGHRLAAARRHPGVRGPGHRSLDGVGPRRPALSALHDGDPGHR